MFCPHLRGAIYPKQMSFLSRCCIVLGTTVYVLLALYHFYRTTVDQTFHSLLLTRRYHVFCSWNVFSISIQWKLVNAWSFESWCRSICLHWCTVSRNQPDKGNVLFKICHTLYMPYSARYSQFYCKWTHSIT